MDKKCVIIDKEKKQRKVSLKYEEHIFEQKNQIEYINKLFQNIDFEEKQICMSEIKKKLNSYKNQDIVKKRSIENIINLNEIVEKLVSSQLKCYYCREKVKLIFQHSRESSQWTLDRLNNYYAHTNDNVVISCLKCNLEKRRENYDNFKFSKQLKINKQYY